MQVLVINQSEVYALLPMQECIAVMADALAALARGEAVLPLRPVLMLPERNDGMAMMPAYLGHLNVMGLKVISFFLKNYGTEYDTHQGVITLFETSHGRLLAIVDATAITAIRTGAVSAVATRLLSRGEANDLAILGTGTQARGHLEAMLQVRGIERVRVWSNDPQADQHFSESESRKRGKKIEVMPSAEAAVREADLICTTTSAREPVLRGEWLSAGTHINAVGSSVPFSRELDTQAVLLSKLFVDRRESTLNEAGDFLIPKKEGAIGDEHILGEIGELLIGKKDGRKSEEEITLFKSLGLAIEDIAAAHHVYQKAVRQQLGQWVEIGGTRHEGT